MVLNQEMEDSDAKCLKLKKELKFFLYMQRKYQHFFWLTSLIYKDNATYTSICLKSRLYHYSVQELSNYQCMENYPRFAYHYHYTAYIKQLYFACNWKDDEKLYQNLGR